MKKIIIILCAIILSSCKLNDLGNDDVKVCNLLGWYERLQIDFVFTGNLPENFKVYINNALVKGCDESSGTPCLISHEIVSNSIRANVAFAIDDQPENIDLAIHEYDPETEEENERISENNLELSWYEVSYPNNNDPECGVQDFARAEITEESAREE